MLVPQLLAAFTVIASLLHCGIHDESIHAHSRLLSGGSYNFETEMFVVLDDCSVNRAHKNFIRKAFGFECRSEICFLDYMVYSNPSGFAMSNCAPVDTSAVAHFHRRIEPISSMIRVPIECIPNSDIERDILSGCFAGILKERLINAFGCAEMAA